MKGLKLSEMSMLGSAVCRQTGAVHRWGARLETNVTVVKMAAELGGRSAGN